MSRSGVALLEFNPALNLRKKKRLRDGLSSVIQIGRTLWVANDETVTLERLLHQGQTPDSVHRYSNHTQFALHDYLPLPVPPPVDPADTEEADIEGMDYEGGYLWLVGSHSRKRKTAEQNDTPAENSQCLATVRKDGNRFLLARIPLVEERGAYILKKTAKQNGNRLVAAQLQGDAKRNDLLAAMKKDPHLHSFLAIPGKDNGFDVEGLAVAGSRLFLGLRGPVLRGWALILEVEPREKNHDASTLKLKRIGPDGSRYRKHFLQLGGLGI